MNINEIKNLFDKHMEGSSFWSRLVGGEFYTYLITFLSQIFYRATAALERALLDAHISLAIRPAAIRAHARDRGYIPLKRVATAFYCEVANTSDVPKSIPAFQPLTNDAGVEFVNAEPIILNAGETAKVEFIQASKLVKSFEIKSEKKYIELTLDQALTRELAEISVFVTDPVTQVRESWKQSYIFRNTEADSKVYVEFHDAYDRVGVMFGNGVRSGAIPTIGSIVDIECLKTNGEYVQPYDQVLTFADDSFSDLTVVAKETITSGQERESVESIRVNAQYFTVYDENTIFNEDYSYFVRRNVRGLTYLRVWGEAEQEELKGAPSLTYMGKIYICAFHPDMTPEKTAEDIGKAFEGVKFLNKSVSPVVAQEQKYSITVKGKTLSSRKIEDVEKEVKNALKVFTKEDAKHNGKVTKNALWERIQGTGLLTEFDITAIQGDLDNEPPVHTFRYMDLDACSVTITY